MEKFIKISKDFSSTPGARYISDGKFSGEEFYKSILKTAFNEVFKANGRLIIDLDGTHGYATSFLDEAFGSLAKEFGIEQVLKFVSFISEEEPYLIDEIKDYINESKQSFKV
jgi:hypothetical protein